MIRFAVILSVLTTPSWADPIVVFAASSLKAPLDEVFQDEDVVVSYGGSGAMAQQIAQGAPADIYISANPQWMDWLSGQGLIQHDLQIDLLGNLLVLVGDADLQLRDAVLTGPIAMGQVSSVPAGIYAKEALEYLGVWNDVAATAIQVPSVTAAARLVALGEVPMAIVYATDAIASALNIIAIFPVESHAPIIYPAAVVQGADSDAQTVWRALQSPEASQVFISHGFTILAAP